MDKQLPFWTRAPGGGFTGPQPAVVTEENDDGSVDVTVFDLDAGATRNVQGVQLHPGRPEPDLEHYCEWAQAPAADPDPTPGPPDEPIPAEPYPEPEAAPETT